MTAGGSRDLSGDALDVICPFHLVVGTDGTLERVGPSLGRVAPAVRPGAALADLVRAEAPVGVELPDGGLGAPAGTLVVLRVLGTGLALRGHVVRDRDRAVFLGSPWVTRLDQLGELGLTISDFAVSDAVLDHLLMQQLQEHALEQSRRLAAELRTAAGELFHRASYDELTGLANRSQVRRVLDRAGAPVAVLLLDLDDFKDVNGGLGHAVGDEVLQQVARRVSAVVRSGDTVARLGGDEFVVLLPGVGGAAAAKAVAEKIVAAVGEPLLVAGGSLCMGAAVGIAVADGSDVQDSGTLLKRADLAMYRAKQTGCGWAVFDAAEDDVASERVRLVDALRRALAQGEVSVAYQPVVDPVTGRAVGVEALARWYDEDRGHVPPDRFIPVAEQSGLIVPLTRSVLRQSLTACAAWCADGLDLGVAVNLSVHAVRRTDVPAMVTEELARAGVDPCRLTVEITESELADDGPRLREALAALRATGVTLSIDDFGTGFSSMSYLKRLPAQVLKIDRSFVRDLETDPRDLAIVRTLVQLAHGLSLGVVAEGVETDGALRMLAQMGCDLVQGYAVARPMPGDELLRWLERGRDGFRASA